MSSRISLLSAIVNLIHLYLLIAVGIYFGAVAGHQIGAGTGLLEYGGASTLIGFGLLNRIIHSSMFRIGSARGCHCARPRHIARLFRSPRRRNLADMARYRR